MEACSSEIRGRPKIQKGVCLARTLSVEGEPPKLVLPLATKDHPLTARNPRGAVSMSRSFVIGEADLRVKIKVTVVIGFIIVVGLPTRIVVRPIVAVDDEDASRPSSFRYPLITVPMRP